MSKPAIFTVETGLVTDLEKTPADLRMKDVFEFKSYSAIGLDITLRRHDVFVREHETRRRRRLSRQHVEGNQAGREGRETDRR